MHSLEAVGTHIHILVVFEAMRQDDIPKAVSVDEGGRGSRLHPVVPTVNRNFRFVGAWMFRSK